MDETLLSFSESRLRTIFGRWNNKSEGDEAQIPEGADPLYPSLDAEPPEIHRRERSLYRPPWDPRDRWRQLRPTQPLHAPPESDLPEQFRYESLAEFQKSETMDIHQDRLLNWLMERFNRGLQFKYSGQASELSADEAVQHQVFTSLQILDEQLDNLGLSGADLQLHERRRQLLEAPPTAAAATADASATATTSKLSSSSTWEQENEDDEFSQFVSPVQQNQVVVTVHEAAPKQQQRKRQPLPCGDLASDSTIECQVDIRGPQHQHQPHHQPHHRVAQFGDAPSCESGGGGSSGAGGVRKSGRKVRIAEDAV